MAVTSFPGLPEQVAPPTWSTAEALPHAVAGADVLAVPVLTGDGDTGILLGPGADEIADLLGLDLLVAAEALDHTGKPGQLVRLPAGEGRVLLLVGAGSGTPNDLRKAGAALGRAARDADRLATTVASVGTPDTLRAFVAGLNLASFGFTLSTAEPEHRPVRAVVLADVPAEARDQVEADLLVAEAVAGASWNARLLATVPSNVKNPAWLADAATALAEQSGIDLDVWDEQQLAEHGFGGVVAVGQGSATPPRFLQLRYTAPGADKNTPTVALVGKGITFDSGGLSIKPGESMSTMKRDMTGGAVVLGVLGALAAAGCRVNVVGLVPAAENAVGGRAMRPGDVLVQYGGRTTEVTNTDAEGRLVLADALAWAADTVKPDVLVDIATLTGAMKVALGLHTGGYFATDEALAGALAAAGERSGERVWRMPLTADYEPNLDSAVADADNAPGGPGAITAALFLQHFTGGLPWAHFDVASVGDTLAERDEWTVGPSGFGARLLLDWLLGEDPLAGIGDDA